MTSTGLTSLDRHSVVTRITGSATAACRQHYVSCFLVPAPLLPWQRLQRQGLHGTRHGCSLPCYTVALACRRRQPTVCTSVRKQLFSSFVVYTRMSSNIDIRCNFVAKIWLKHASKTDIYTRQNSLCVKPQSLQSNEKVFRRRLKQSKLMSSLLSMLGREFYTAEVRSRRNSCHRTSCSYTWN